jgi:hypothetical protein
MEAHEYKCMTAVEISSANSAAKLKFSDFDGSYFTASLISPAVCAEVRVYAATDLEVNTVAALVGLFKTMSEGWKGWQGKLTWASLEGELEIVATADSLGHVNLRLMFREHDGPMPWFANIDFTLESMQVEKAYKRLAQVFS